jgi:hypothetical protein
METAIRRDPRGQGDQGEASAISWLLESGLPVFMPIGHSPDIDLITLIDVQVVRVQVKTSTVFRKNRWDVTVCTRGGATRVGTGWSSISIRPDTTACLLWWVTDGVGSSRPPRSKVGADFASVDRNTSALRSSGAERFGHRSLARLSALRRDTRAVKGTRL